MSRNRAGETVATVRVGDTVTRCPVTLQEPGKAKNALSKAMKGTVVYVHPEAKFHVVEFAGGVREAFDGVQG